MGIISNIGSRKYQPGPGVYVAPPEKGIKRFFFLLKTHFWKLLSINMVFIVCCIPIVTIPASLCALDRYLIKMVRDGYDFDISDYFHEFKTSFFKSLPSGLLFAALLAWAGYLFSLSYANGKTVDVSTPLVMSIIVVLFVLLYSSYVFLLTAMLDLKVGHILKNSLILMFCDLRTTLKVFLITSISTALCIFLVLAVPYTIFLPLVCWISFTHLMLCCAINPTVDKFIIKPFEAKQAAENGESEESAEEESEAKPAVWPPTPDYYDRDELDDPEEDVEQ